MNFLRFFILYFCDYVYIYVMILRFLFFIQTFLKYCKALSTEKYKRYINILLLLFIIIPFGEFKNWISRSFRQIQIRIFDLVNPFRGIQIQIDGLVIYAFPFTVDSKLVRRYLPALFPIEVFLYSFLVAAICRKKSENAGRLFLIQ